MDFLSIWNSLCNHRSEARLTPREILTRQAFQLASQARFLMVLMCRRVHRGFKIVRDIAFYQRNDYDPRLALFQRGPLNTVIVVDAMEFCLSFASSGVTECSTS